jgi:phospholipid transport system transporter-binding protein
MGQKEVTVNSFSAESDGVYRITGLMTFETVPDLLEHTASWADSHHDGITIDMKEVTRVDSAGLALMMEWLRFAGTAKRALRFTNLPDQARNLIRISGLENAFRTE